MLTLNDGRNELWQWDTGRTLAVDADCSQVHFSNKVFGRSIDVDVIDGVSIIPDILLQTDKDLNAWAFVGTAENGYTKISKTFKVNRRNKPADYVFTPPDQTSLEEIKEKIEYLESIQDPDAIKNAVEDYLEQNPVEVPVQSVNGRTGEVKLTAEDVGAISQDDLQNATNEALAQAKASGEFDGPQGQKGDPGEKGDKGDTGPAGPKGEKGDAVSLDITLTQEGQAADAKAVGDAISQLSEEKVSLPKDTDGNVIHGTVGWYAVSDGAGGITWVESAPSTGGGGETTTHGIVWNLVNVTSSNNAVSVADGSSFVAVLTPADGYALGDVTITMGGEVVTGAWNADTATVTIQSVTGDVVISCAGVEQTGPVDTSPVIEKTGYGLNMNGGTTAWEGLCYTKMYELEYLSNASLIVYAPSVEGVTTSSYSKIQLFKDGAFVTYYSMVYDTEKKVGISGSSYPYDSMRFTLFEGQAENSYIYVEATGNIVFAGKNTKYYGMANIDGTMAGGEPVAAELSYDDDVAQNYSVETTSILGEETATDTSTAYGISSNLAAIIDEVRKSWMIEYGGDYRKIPLVITTDQHGRTNSGIFNMLGKTLSLHDVSKIMNLGDTCAVEWIDSDSDHPLLSCSALENWCESIKAIPFSKRLDVYGNHDSWYYDGYSVDGNPIGTRYPSTMHHLDQYFRNIYARRNNNHGWGAIYDDYFNVKYVVVTGFEFKDGSSTQRIGTAQMTWLISELEKNDGYDVIIVSHVPLRVDPSQMIYPTADSYEDGVYHISGIDTDAMFAARKTGGTGTITDSDGVEHTYDFSGCENPVLCSLHGHTHEDAYLYLNNELLVNAFDWFDGNTIFFVLVDRVDRQLNIWKVEGDAMSYQNYQIPLDKPTE